jgi:hypothetical protein
MAEDTVTLGIVVAVCSTVGPALIAIVQSINKRKEKDQDYAREDAVALQAAEAAKLLVERQDAIAAKTAETARLLAVNTRAVTETAHAAAEVAQRTNDKLDVIHVLVNSNMTAAMQAELDATLREAAMIQEVIELKKAAGSEPTVETLAALESARNKIGELGSALKDRLRAVPVSQELK